MAEYKVGEKVIISKYGKKYFGRVVAVGRVRVTVEFKLLGGGVKHITLAGHEVPHLLRRPRYSA